MASAQIRKKVDERDHSQSRMLMCEWVPDGVLSPDNVKVDFTIGFNRAGYFLYDCHLYPDATNLKANESYKVWIGGEPNGKVTAEHYITWDLYSRRPYPERCQYEKERKKNPEISSQWLTGPEGQRQNRLDQGCDTDCGSREFMWRICESVSPDTTKATYIFDKEERFEMHDVPLDVHVTNMLQKAAMPSFDKIVTQHFSASIDDLTLAATKTMECVDSYFRVPRGGRQQQQRKLTFAGKELTSAQHVAPKMDKAQKILFREFELEFVQSVVANDYATIEEMRIAYQTSRQRATL